MKRIYLFLVALFLAAAAITALGKSIAAAPGAEVISYFIAQPLPLSDPESEWWQMAAPVDVPLSAQTVARPFHLEPVVRSLRLRSLNNGRWIAFLLEWEDGAKNTGLGLNEHQDAVAIQLPTTGGQPFACMGMSDQYVNILQWRADYQEDVEKGFPELKEIYPRLQVNPYPLEEEGTYMTARAVGNFPAHPSKSSPVEELRAGGYGTLVSLGSNEAVGWGAWQGGEWKVVIARPMTPSYPGDAPLRGDTKTYTALAVWDGGNQEVGGQKAVSAWLNLKVEGREGFGAGPSAMTVTLIAIWWLISLAGVSLVAWRSAQRGRQSE